MISDKHNLETKRNFNFKDSKIFGKIRNQQHKKIVESSIISNDNTIKQKQVSFDFSSLVQLRLNSYNIPY